MHAKIKKMVDITEFETEERCLIAEISNDSEDEEVSIARARVKAGEITAWHKLNGVTERYIITQGKGLVEIGDLPPTPVAPGDVVLIPADCPQRIHNTGDEMLIFFAVCSPRFTDNCYVHLENGEYVPYETTFR